MVARTVRGWPGDNGQRERVRGSDSAGFVVDGVLAQMNPVTRQVQVGSHRIEATVSGSGAPAVVVEPGFASTAASWRTVAEAVAEDTTVVTYDRVPYGASSRARDARRRKTSRAR